MNIRYKVGLIAQVRPAEKSDVRERHRIFGNQDIRGAQQLTSTGLVSDHHPVATQTWLTHE